MNASLVPAFSFSSWRHPLPVCAYHSFPYRCASINNVYYLFTCFWTLYKCYLLVSFCNLLFFPSPFQIHSYWCSKAPNINLFAVFITWIDTIIFLFMNILAVLYFCCLKWCGSEHSSSWLLVQVWESFSRLYIYISEWNCQTVSYHFWGWTRTLFERAYYTFFESMSFSLLVFIK